MKVKKLTKKISLKKQTIATLNNEEMLNQRGGVDTELCTYPILCTFDTFCYTDCTPRTRCINTCPLSC